MEVWRIFSIFLTGIVVVCASTPGYIRRWLSSFCGFGSQRASSHERIFQEVITDLYEFYAPIGEASAEIVVFHGLQRFSYVDAFWKTWLTGVKNSVEVWPQTWLQQDFSSARVLSVSYDSCARVGPRAGRYHMYTIGETLVHCMILWKHVGQNSPVVLVGHSLGGLVIKQLIFSAVDKLKEFKMEPEKFARDIKALENFLGNVEGVFYFSILHCGSRMADLVDVIPGNSEVLKFLTLLNKNGSRLNEFFRRWRTAHGVQAYSVYEKFKTTIWPGFAEMVVVRGSVTQDSDGYYGAPADHIQVCKLEQKDVDARYQLLTEFIASCTGMEIAGQ